MTGAAPAGLIVRPFFYGGNFELFRAQELEVCLDGPAGTGKTIAALNKVHLMLHRYPGSRALICRKRNTDLAASALVTFQSQVLHLGERVRYYGGSRARPAAFLYPNGAEAVVSGLDKPEKVKSAEYDLVYYNEATDGEEQDVELLRSRLRNGRMPYHQLIMDCNPSYPSHWLNQRMQPPGLTYDPVLFKTRRILSRHDDNPRYWDRGKGEWTAAGVAYIQDVLGGLTGVYYDRLVRGEWVAAEGRIYDEWDAALHILGRDAASALDFRWDAGLSTWRPPSGWPVYVSMDHGFTAPFVAQWWALDGDGRAYLYREVYQTSLTPEERGERCAKYAQGDPLPRHVVGDSEDPAANTVIGRMAHWNVSPAQKGKDSKITGIGLVQQRLKRAGDGRPRLQFLPDVLVQRDPELSRKKQPTSTAEEMESYVWDMRNGARRGERPLDGFDHGEDAMNYLFSYLDLRNREVQVGPRFW